MPGERDVRWPGFGRCQQFRSVRDACQDLTAAGLDVQRRMAAVHSLGEQSGVTPRRSGLRRPAVEPREVPAFDGYCITLCDELVECRVRRHNRHRLRRVDHIDTEYEGAAQRVNLCDASTVIASYRGGLFLATLCFMAGVALLIASVSGSGLGLVAAVIIIVGSMSLIRGLRRRIVTPASEVAPPARAYSRYAVGRHR
jgi:hypothetical protein